jgi:hypothetical protein
VLPLRFELTAQLGVVVDLAVEDQLPAAAPGGHRLVAQGREIQNRQAPVDQAGPGVLPDTGIIRSPVGEAWADPGGEVARFPAQLARDAAHPP